MNTPGHYCLLKLFNYSCKKLHFRCFTEFWIRLWPVKSSSSDPAFHWRPTIQIWWTYGHSTTWCGDITYQNCLNLNYKSISSHLLNLPDLWIFKMRNTGDRIKISVLSKVLKWECWPEIGWIYYQYVNSVRIMGTKFFCSVFSRRVWIHQIFTCSKSITETLEKGVKYV